VLLIYSGVDSTCNFIEIMSATDGLEKGKKPLTVPIEYSTIWGDFTKLRVSVLIYQVFLSSLFTT
jgi:hypothetical protein